MTDENGDLDLLKLASEDTTKTNEDNVFSLPDSHFNLPLRISSFNSAKDFENFVKGVERVVRYSQEYKLWVKYISEHLGHSECALTKESINECSLEIHHHPITLYTVVKSVLNDMMSKKQEFSTFDVSTKVIELHFQNKVGYIVLLSDLHKKYHSGFLNLPVELVHGDYKHILQTYSIEENEYDKICRLCGFHLEDMKQTWNKDNYPGIEDEVHRRQLEESSDKKELIA
jgi:hypothetical protein